MPAIKLALGYIIGIRTFASLAGICLRRIAVIALRYGHIEAKRQADWHAA
jgi:hypothetical protein